MPRILGHFITLESSQCIILGQVKMVGGESTVNRSTPIDLMGKEVPLPSIIFQGRSPLVLGVRGKV